MTVSHLPSLLTSYRSLLEQMDHWFHRCQEAYPSAIHCDAGCSACCRALFDISLLDALLLRQGFEQLSRQTQQEIQRKAAPILQRLEAQWPGFRSPWLLNDLPEELWLDIPQEDNTPCPLLDEDGRCQVYAHRPMLCRLHGLPQVDRSGEVFSDRCCSLNFTRQDPMALKTLRWDFKKAFTAEFELLQTLTAELGDLATTEVDTLIPAAVFLVPTEIDWPLVLSQREGGASNDPDRS